MKNGNVNTDNKNNNVNDWIKNRTPNKIKALENASRYFGDNDAFTVNYLEAIYGQESSFGAHLRKAGIKGASGHFQMERRTAERYLKTKITEQNDPRQDINSSSRLAAWYIVDLNKSFSKSVPLGKNLNTIAVSDINERKLFVTAAYNAGEGRIAKAQIRAKKAGKNPEIWYDVKNFLVDPDTSEKKAKEITQYVEKVTRYEKEFSEKSSADKTAKNKKPLKLSLIQNGHWVTLEDGRHVLIKEKA